MTQMAVRPIKVFVVEDEPLIAMAIIDALDVLGCDVVGPVGRLDEAIDIVGSQGMDCAILDVNVRGGHIYPVADLLIARGTPILLASGYGEWTLPKRLADQKCLPKPYTTEQLEDELRGLCDRATLAPGWSPTPHA